LKKRIKNQDFLKKMKKKRNDSGFQGYFYIKRPIAFNLALKAAGVIMSE